MEITFKNSAGECVCKGEITHECCKNIVLWIKTEGFLYDIPVGSFDEDVIRNKILSYRIDSDELAVKKWQESKKKKPLLSFIKEAESYAETLEELKKKLKD